MAQAYAIAQWAPNVNVKIPVTDCSGRFQGPLIHRLTASGIAVNVTAVLTLQQVERVLGMLPSQSNTIISVFAGRIADTGVDPVPLMRNAARLVRAYGGAQLLWASPREVLNFYQAEESGCDIITMPPDLVAKLSLAGKSLEQYSLETVEMFYQDAQAAAYSIDISGSLVAAPAAVPPSSAGKKARPFDVLDLAAASKGAVLP